MSYETTHEAIQQKFGEFFEPTEIKWKPQTVRENRALALCYVDARVIMDRLDEVVGVGNWMDHYERLDNDTVKCTLKVRIGDTWIEKEDVGGVSEQPDEGDRTKAAFSDALKRAAVKFGIGRYLYRMPQQWVDFDPKTKRFVNTPTLPNWAIPKDHRPPSNQDTKPEPTKPEPTKQPEPAKQEPKKPSAEPPKNAAELFERLRAKDKELAEAGLCARGELLDQFEEQTQDYPSDLMDWMVPEVESATKIAWKIINEFSKRKRVKR